MWMHRPNTSALTSVLIKTTVLPRSRHTPQRQAVTRHLHSSARKEPVRLQKDTQPWGW